MITPLAKKTKAELLEEYNKLLTQYDDLKRIAQLVSEPQSVELFSKVAGNTTEQLTKSIEDLKTSVNTTLVELADKLIIEARKFEEIQKAIEIAKKNLELHYNIQVAADTIDRLIAEHKSQTAALEEEIAGKKRDWEREQEEHEYATKLHIRHAQEGFEEMKAKQDRALKEREEALVHQEQEMARLRGQVEGFPAQQEKALVQKEQETAKRLRSEFDLQFAIAKKDWAAEKNIYEMRITNLEERIKGQNAENAALRQEIEKANKRVQELAVKIIEGGPSTRSVLKSEELREVKES